MTLWHIDLRFLPPNDKEPAIQFEIYADLPEDAYEWAEAWVAAEQPQWMEPLYYGALPWVMEYNDHVGNDPERTNEEIMRVWSRDYRTPTYKEHLYFEHPLYHCH